MNANENMGMTEEQALAQQLDGMNASLDAIYVRLGKAYYELKSETPDAELVSIVDEVKALYDQQKKIDTRIKFLKGIVVCTSCGQENGVASSFCCNCGSTLPHKLAQMDGSHCTKCGAALVPGTKFCGVCGSKIENPIAAQEPVGTPVVEAPVAPVVETPVVEAPVVEAPAAPAVEPQAPAQEAFVMQENVENVNGPVYNAGVEPMPAPVDEKRFCANCGAQILESDAMFCAECGARI